MKRWWSMAALSISLALLVALLAVVQWRWLSEIEAVEHYRRDSRLNSSTSWLKLIFEREISGLARSVAAARGPRAEAADELGERLERWRASSRWPGLVADIYLVEAPPGGSQPPLTRSLPETGAFAPAAWPAVPDQALAGLGEPGLREALEASSGYLVVPSIPALLVAPRAWGDTTVAVVLDPGYMATEMFPEIVDLVFPPPSFISIEVAVVEVATGRVLYSNLDIRHASDFGAADKVMGLVREGAPRHDYRSVSGMLRPGVSGPHPGVSAVPPSSSRAPRAGDEEWFEDLWSWIVYVGHWQVLVRDGENPIVDAAAAVRVRRAIAAFSLLAVLSSSIALMTVATRRTQRAAREQMEQIARVSHELRSPLAVLASAGDNLADGLARGDGKVRQYGRVIQREAGRLLEMVENVLYLSRRRAGAPQMKPQRFDLVDLVDGTLAALEPSLREAGFAVEKSLPASPVEIVGVPLALRSVVVNLLSNAVKHGASPKRPHSQWLRLAVELDSGREARVVVEDRGPGIPARELPGIFEPYVRGERAMENQTEGSGLGLAVVKEVVEAVGGRVSVRSLNEGGAAFTLHLPLAVGS